MWDDDDDGNDSHTNYGQWHRSIGSGDCESEHPSGCAQLELPEEALYAAIDRVDLEEVQALLADATDGRAWMEFNEARGAVQILTAPCNLERFPEDIVRVSRSLDANSRRLWEQALDPAGIPGVR